MLAVLAYGCLLISKLFLWHQKQVKDLVDLFCNTSVLFRPSRVPDDVSQWLWRSLNFSYDDNIRLVLSHKLSSRLPSTSMSLSGWILITLANASNSWGCLDYFDTPSPLYRVNSAGCALYELWLRSRWCSYQFRAHHLLISNQRVHICLHLIKRFCDNNLATHVCIYSRTELINMSWWSDQPRGRKWKCELAVPWPSKQRVRPPERNHHRLSPSWLFYQQEQDTQQQEGLSTTTNRDGISKRWRVSCLY